MLLAHGYGCDQTMWRHLVPAFENDFRIILFDYVGHGQSDPSAFDRDRYGTLAGYADDVLSICEALAVRDAVFVGHSVSSMIGILAAQKNPSRFSSLSAHPGIAKHFARVTFLSDNRADLAKVTHPCLILQCSNDAIAPQAVGEYVHSRIPNSELTLLSAVGHCPDGLSNLRRSSLTPSGA